MYCVIVGDIIRSKSLDQIKRNESTEAIKRILDYINNKYENNILAKFGIVRGDAFEGVLFSQQTIPQIVQDIIIELFEEDVKVRISAAMGELSVVSAKRNIADGPAFYSALNRIEYLRKYNSNHWFQVSMLTDSIGQPLVDGLLNMIAALTKGWTQKQAQIVWTMIRCENKQTLVSDKLGMSPSLVSKQLKAAQYDAYQTAWKGLEKYLIELEETSISSTDQPSPTYTTYYSLANRKTEQGEYSAAIAFYEEALTLAMEEFGKDSHNLVRIYNGLINGYLELVQSRACSLEKRNENLELIERYIIAAFNCQDSLPKIRIEYARTIALKGDYLTLLQKYDDALLQYEEAIQILKYCDQPEPRWIFECYNNMALLYEKKGKEKDALDTLKIAFQYAEQNKESDSIAYAAALHNLGMLYNTIGKKDEAINLLTKALATYMNFLPAKNQRVVMVKKALDNLKPE